MSASAAHEVTTESEIERGRLIVGLDGSDESVDALRWAVNHAAAFHSRVEAVYVYPTPRESGWTLHKQSASWSPALANVVKCAEQELDRAVRRAVFDPTAVPLTSSVVSDADPAAGLISIARDDDTIVVGSRHRVGMRRHVGATSAALLSNAPCPVVVVPEGAEAAKPSSTPPSLVRT